MTITTDHQRHLSLITTAIGQRFTVRTLAGGELGGPRLSVELRPSGSALLLDPGTADELATALRATPTSDLPG